MSIRQEDIAAENILKRAELTRITRQLKSRLSKTNLKSKLKDKSNGNLNGLLTGSTTGGNIQSHGGVLKATTPKKQIRHKKSVDSIDANKTEDESSPVRNNSNGNNIHRTALPPSSPLYEEFQIPIIPKTPPQQKINLNTDIYNSTSTNKTQPTFSSPARTGQQQGSATQQQNGILSTPKRSGNHDEGADLLMFLATSPSPIQYKNYPSTPSRSLQNTTTSNPSGTTSNPSSTFKISNSQSLGSNLHKFATPNTPKRSITNTLNNNLNINLKTPGFNMNDYVNLFSPSPRISRTPGGPITNQNLNSSSNLGQEKDINGKLIKF